jgi:hypothetical protein
MKRAIQLICPALPYIAQVIAPPAVPTQRSWFLSLTRRIIRRRRHRGKIRSIAPSACHCLRCGDLRERQFELGECLSSPQGCSPHRRQAIACSVRAAVLQSDIYSRWSHCIIKVDPVASDLESDLPPVQSLFHPSSPAVTPVPCRRIRTRDQSDWEYALCILSA